MRSESYLSNLLRTTPDVVKNLIIINTLMFLATLAFRKFMITHFALFYPENPLFHPYQILTHMFMHADFFHLFFNMYALWMFGRILEYSWGSKRFLFYYLFTGIGASLLHLFVLWLQMTHIEHLTEPGMLNAFKEYLTTGEISDLAPQDKVLAIAQEWSSIYIRPTIGASGAVFGLLLAFGMMFPEWRLQLLFPPIELKAKWFVLFYGLIELVLGLTYATSTIAHFAHIGGMLFGIGLILYWKKKGTLYKKRY